MPTVHDSAGIPKPLAAYRLGHLSRTFSIWRDLFLSMPEFEWGTADGLYLSVLQLSEAVVTLAADMPLTVYAELRSFLADQEKLWASVTGMVSQYWDNKAPWNEQLLELAAQEPQPGLRLLADVACAHLGVLEQWAKLGLETGAYALLLRDENHVAPALEGVIGVARTLPAETLHIVPVLEKLLEHACRSPIASPRALLTDVLRSCGQSTANEVYGPSFDAFVVGNLMLDFDRAVQEALYLLPWPEAKLAPDERLQDSLKPRWEKERDGVWVGTLWVGKHVVRELRPLAVNVIKVLDAFEEDRWPSRIDDPLSGDDPQRRHDTIRSLNDGLKLIRFRGDGKNEGIVWCYI